MSIARQLLVPPFSEDYRQRVLGIDPAHLLGYWPLAERSGGIALDASGNSGPAEIVRNGGFETAGSTFASWSDHAGDGSIGDETTIVHGGSHAARISSGASLDSWIIQSQRPVYPGSSLTLSLWARGDGTDSGRYGLYDGSNSSWIVPLSPVGISAASWSQFTLPVTMPAGCSSVWIYLAGPAAAGGTAYFDDVSLSGTLPYHGWYPAGGATLGSAGIGDGLPGVSFDGNDSVVRLGSSQISAGFDSGTGSAIAWAKVDGAGRWTDSSCARWIFHPRGTDSWVYYITFGKNDVDHQIEWRRRAGGPMYSQTHTFSPAGPTGWFCMGFSWDIANTRFRGYLTADGSWQKLFDDGSASYGVEPWDLGTYPVDGGDFVLYGGSLEAQEWIGGGAHAACWAGACLSDAQMRAVMTV